MRRLAKEIKRGSLRKVLYLVLFCFSFFALAPRVDGAVAPGKAMTKAERQQDMAKVQSVLEKKEVSSRLESLGLSKAEVAKRLAMVPDQDLHKLALEFDKLNPGQDFLGLIIALLIIAALVVVILYYTGHLGYTVKVEKKGEQPPPKKK